MTYAEDASKAHRAYRTAIQKARSFADPDLSPDAIQTKRTELEQAAENQHARDRRDIEAAAKDRNATASAAAGEARPKITDHTHVAARWAQYKPLFDAGRTVRQVLAKADVAGVQAVQDYGPSYFEAKAGMPAFGQEPVEIPDIARLCDDRFVALGGDAASYITSERETRADLERARVYTQSSGADSDLALAVKANLTGVQPADGDDGE